jgi:hypothetical protein
MTKEQIENNLPTYEQFIEKYGNRPKDIIYKLAVRFTYQAMIEASYRKVPDELPLLDETDIRHCLKKYYVEVPKRLKELWIYKLSCDLAHAQRVLDMKALREG